MKKRYGLIVSLILIATLLWGCKKPTLNDDDPDISNPSANDILSFSLPMNINPGIKGGIQTGVIDNLEQTVTVKLDDDSDIKALKAVFTLSEGAEARIDRTIQESGVTVNDFSQSLIYRIKSFDGTVKEYTVKVILTPAPSRKADLLSLTVGESTFYPDSNNKIYIRTSGSVSSIKPEIILSLNSTVALDQQYMDFTKPQTIRVTAQDGRTTKEYNTVYCPSVGQISGGQIPSLAWCSIPEDFTSVERYKQLKDAGFDYSITQYMSSKEKVLSAIECAAQTGIKLITICWEIDYDFENTVLLFKDKPGFGGYYVSDEPSANLFADKGKMTRDILSLDPNTLPYSNMFPNKASTEQLSGVGYPPITYDQYISRFDSEIGCPVVSFDYYPLIYVNNKYELQDTWFENLEDVAALAEKVNKPLWAFALSTPHWQFTAPTIDHLRMQTLVDLAYGAKCIQYFTYWTPVYPGSPFTTAPINPDGTVTPIYYVVQKMNKEIKSLAGLFSSARRITTRFTGSIPRGTTALAPSDLPSMVQKIDTKGMSALVAYLESDQYNILTIHNINPETYISFDISFASDNVYRVMYDGFKYPISGELIPSLAPGNAAIYVWHK